MSAEVENIVEIRIKKPHLYNVVLLNDDYTPMQFVIEILIDIFSKSPADSQILTLEIHEKGRGIAGVFTKEVAEQKVEDTLMVASHYGHPLKAIIEPC